MKNHKLIKWFLPVLLVTLTPQAMAARILTCIPQGSTTEVQITKQSNINPDVIFASASIPSSGDRFNALVRALSLFNRVPANFSFHGVIHGAGANTVVANRWASNPTSPNNRPAFPTNGVNEFYFSNNTAILPSTTPAQNVPDWNLTTCTLNEMDVVFNTNVDWLYTKTASSAIAYGGATGKRQLIPTAIHEIGHYVGLAHENSFYNIMGSDFTHVNHAVSSTGVRVSEGYVGEDAAKGLVSLYNTTPYTAKQDVSLTHWMWSGTTDGNGNPGSYSNHARIPLYTVTATGTTGNVITNCTLLSGVTCTGNLSDAERFYGVASGQQVKLRLGYENNGLWGVNLNVRYYLSTDEAITIADTLIGESPLPTLFRDVPDYQQFPPILK